MPAGGKRTRGATAPPRVPMLLEATSGIASRITGAIRDAARATGASFEYLLKTAQRESNFNPTARASTSSASGLFQFIDQTWLQTLKAAGPDHGYARQAAGIVQTPTGRYVVPDRAARQEIMQLRNDPTAASAMAGAFTQRNAAMLAQRLGRQPTDGELYIAHFLGPTGAVDLITAAAERPDTRAAALFPRAARANRSIFYARGTPRTAGQVYSVLVAKHQNTRMAPAMLAAQPGSTGPTRAGPAPAVELRHAGALGYAPQSGPVFHGLFHAGRAGPISAEVSELWGAGRSRLPAAAGTASGGEARAPAAAKVQPGGPPLPLFQFLRPELRSSRST